MASVHLKQWKTRLLPYLMEFITAEATIKTLIQPKGKKELIFYNSSERKLEVETISANNQNLEFYFCNRQMNKRVQRSFAFGSKSLDHKLGIKQVVLLHCFATHGERAFPKRTFRPLIHLRANMFYLDDPI